mmetsp:Transcript_3334/g.5538  ORF Transcript_3334/g.5538 Transcript_3334/m.5538 type:complete len:219 (+) Transcript_3334:634-1290(+)
MGVRRRVGESVKDSLMVQMNELQQWGVMADWRYSYFTSMPAYQSMVLRSFADLIKRNQIYWGDRPVLWSVKEQKILAEEEIDQQTQIVPTFVLKAKVCQFGAKAKHVQNLYPDVKLLIYVPQPWQTTGLKAAAVNEKITYVVAKWRDEYLIVAEKRLGELQLRSGHRFKKLISFLGDTLEGMKFEHPIGEMGGSLPIVINNEVMSDHGSGVNGVVPAH